MTAGARQGSARVGCTGSGSLPCRPPEPRPPAGHRTFVGRMAVVPGPYDTVHRLLKSQRGLASNYLCSCGAPAVDWAYQWTGDIQYDDGCGLAYSPDPINYAAMCRSCHRKLDSSKPTLMRASVLSNAAIGRDRLAILQADPVESVRIRRLQSEGAIRAISVRRQCAECSLVASPPSLGRHQKVSGHSGWSTCG